MVKQPLSALLLALLLQVSWSHANLRVFLDVEDTLVNDECVSKIAQGKVIGEYFAPWPTCVYKGIPFAQSPVGELRFKPPRSPLPFVNGEFLATQFGPGCIQKCTLQHPELTCPSETSEDCLTLNLYTPATKRNAKPASPLPVIVFIHGGNYVQGAGGVPMYHGSRWASNHQVVMVTINYRLGVLGGLYTARGEIAGNFQLGDQRMAMRWVQENIAAFGGDPHAVTIMGQSAGAFSVASHLASPSSWQFFHRAIILSDPVALPAETTRKSKELSKRVVKALGCERVWESEESACLRAVPAEEILKAQKETSFPTEPGLILHKFMPWTPVITADEMPLSPMEASKKGKLASVPVLIGTVANESVQFVWEASPSPMPLPKYKLFIDAIFGMSQAHEIFKHYGNPPADMVEEGDVRPFLSKLGTDYIFTCSVQSFAADVSKQQPVFVYYYDHMASFNKYLQEKSQPECVPYICHGSDLPVLFETVFLSPDSDHPELTFEEQVLGDQMQAMWTNFARSGDPNSPYPVPSQIGSQPPVFRPFRFGHRDVFRFSVSAMENNFKAHECELFDQFGYEKN